RVGAILNRPLPLGKRPALRVGRVIEVDKMLENTPHIAKFDAAYKTLGDMGAEIVPISIENMDKTAAIYMVFARTECPSNLNRFDGIRYGSTVDAENIKDIYKETRERHLTIEVKCRIMIGNLLLADAQRKDTRHAQAFVNDIKDDFDVAFAR